MTEKQYGGSTGRGTGNKSTKSKQPELKPKIIKEKKKEKPKEKSDTKKDKILLAGKTAAEVKKYARTIIKKGVPLLEIAEKIENKMSELGVKPSFPTNLSINEVAAHYTPSYDDKNLAHGLIKVDLGTHVDGWISDTAFSLDLENSEENKKLIQVSEEALENAIKIIKPEKTVSEIGKIIQNTIESKGFSVIINLSGHSIDKYELHSGLTIPNFDNKQDFLIGEGIRAIEPFVTNGNGKVRDGKPSGIYMLENTKNVRSPIARETLNYIQEEYQTMPFCSRWLVKKFGVKALFGLKQLEQNGNLHQFAQLIESCKGIVAQTEQTLLIEKDKTIVTTKED